MVKYLSLMREIENMDKLLQQKGSSIENVIKSLLNFGGDAPEIFKRLEDMENLIAKLELLDDISAQINNIERMLKILTEAKK